MGVSYFSLKSSYINLWIDAVEMGAQLSELKRYFYSKFHTCWVVLEMCCKITFLLWFTCWDTIFSFSPISMLSANEINMEEDFTHWKMNWNFLPKRHINLFTNLSHESEVRHFAFMRQYLQLITLWCNHNMNVSIIWNITKWLANLCSAILKILVFYPRRIWNKNCLIKSTCGYKNTGHFFWQKFLLRSHLVRAIFTFLWP